MADTPRDDELDLLEDEDVESFAGSTGKWLWLTYLLNMQKKIETFRHILDLPDPRETMPRSSTSVLDLDDQKGQQELRPRGPSSMLPLSSHIKDAFDKFEQVFLASNLPEGKYIKPPPSTAKCTRWDSLVLKIKFKS